MMRSDTTIYSVNSNALGDVIAAVAVILWAINTYHKNGNYMVSVRPIFRCLFWFVPESKFYPHDQAYPKSGVAIYELNDCNKKPTNVGRLTPSKLHLSHYASISLLGRILPWEAYNYVPLVLPEVTPLPNAVIMCVAHRDENRSWPAEEILKTAQWLKDNGYLPVFVGKTIDTGDGWKKKAVSHVEAPDYVMDLRDTLSLVDLAAHMQNAKAVVGIDGGGMHLAGTTSVPIVCGFTNVDPATRAIPRKEGKFVAIVPEIECRFCQTNWQLGWHSFCDCYLKTNACVKEMTSDKFIAGLKVALNGGAS